VPLGGLPLCSDLDEKFYETLPWLDCAYLILVKQPLNRYRTNEHLWDWSQKQPMSTHDGDWVTTAGWISHIWVMSSGVMQKDIWWLVAAMGPVMVSSTQHYKIVYHNITACISPLYLLLTGHIMIAEHSNRSPYPYCDITCEHCILTNCVNNSRPLDQKMILIAACLC
jgi:hypothetical protein